MNHPTRQRLQLGLIVVLLLVIAAMAYKFIVVGSVEAAADGRTAIVLEPAERAFVLREMRGFVGGLPGMPKAMDRGFEYLTYRVTRMNDYQITGGDVNIGN